jgi:ABC-type Na+ efflux pump permease subunit
MGPLGALAGHEVRRLGGAFQGRASKAAFAAVVLLLAVAWPAVQQRGLHPDRGLYPVEVRPGATFGPAAQADPRFRAVDQGGVLLLQGDQVVEAGGPAAKAALAELRDGVQRWQEQELAKEPDQAAAFPVQVTLAFQARDLTATAPATATSGTSSASQGPAGAAPPSLAQETANTSRQLPNLRPADVNPPFPVRSLLLAFAYLIPMNFIAQLYAGSLLGERIRHRGLLVLTAPLSPVQVLLGRSLPYLAAGAAILVGSSIAVGAGPLGWLAALPIVAFVLAASLVLGLVARSERELTFLLTGTTTMFSTFLFLPAVFAALPPVAFLSPVSVLSASIEGRAVGWGPFLYATVPLALATLALFLVGAALFREETLFSQQGLARKVAQAVARWTRTRRGLLMAGILLVPFALALELFVLAMVIPLGLLAAFPAFIVGAALLEESLKMLATRARPGRSGWRSGLWVGAGFFVGEKVALVVALAGFGSLQLGVPTLRLLGVQGSPLLLVAPLLLHMGAAAVAGLGKGRRAWGPVAWLAAVALHALYNVAIVAGGVQ